MRDIYMLKLIIVIIIFYIHRLYLELDLWTANKLYYITPPPFLAPRSQNGTAIPLSTLWPVQSITDCFNLFYLILFWHQSESKPVILNINFLLVCHNRKQIKYQDSGFVNEVFLSTVVI
jgi:hypothetical protein